MRHYFHLAGGVASRLGPDDMDSGLHRLQLVVDLSEPITTTPAADASLRDRLGRLPRSRCGGPVSIAVLTSLAGFAAWRLVQYG